MNNKLRWTALLSASVLVLPLFFSSCSKKKGLPLSAPTSNQVGFAGKTKSYDDNFGSDDPAAPNFNPRMLKLQYFDTGSGTHTINLVSKDGSVPGTEPLEFRNWGAITAGNTAWKITISQGGNGWIDPMFSYSFGNDPYLKTDPETPPCWRGGATGEGQDWSAYTNFQCDLWCDPEAPVWAAGGWWLQQVLVYAQGGGALWANEWSLIYPPDPSFSLPDVTMDRKPCNCQYNSYYQQSVALDGTDFRPGINHSIYLFDNNLDRQSALGYNNGDRWTRQAGISSFWFVMGGSVTGMQVGASFYIDNPRVVRSEKPAWEGSLDASAFSEYFPWVPSKNAENATNWVSHGSGSIPFVRKAAGWTNATKWDAVVSSQILNAGEGGAVTLLGGSGSSTCAPGNQGPVTLHLKYRTNDPNMALLVDYSVDGTNNGLIPNGPVTLWPGNTDWQRIHYVTPVPATWDLSELENARLFFKAVDMGGSTTPTVEIDQALLAGIPCGTSCYSPYNADYALGWPDWRK